jgi:hypothetical protein
MATMQELVGGSRILIDRLAGERLHNAAHQDLHVAVVPVVVLGDRVSQPHVISFVRGPPGFPAP